MKKSIFLLLSLCMVMLACSKDEDPYIHINDSEKGVTVTDKGGTQTITFESNMSWTATSSETWCRVSPPSGDASAKSASVTMSANDSYDARNCTVTITAGTMSKSITINQAAQSGLLISQSKYDLTNNASTIEVEVKANVEYEVTIPDKWITQVATRGLNTTELKFEIAENESYESREGSITIKQKNGTLSSTIKVFQSQEDAIILSSKTANLTNEDQTLEVELKTNVDFEVIIPEGGKSWVSFTETRALRTETLLLNIAENEGFEVRTTEVYVKNTATTLQDTLTITQEAGDPFAQKDIEAPRQSFVDLTVTEDFTAIQWEMSSDTNTWYSIENAIEKDYSYHLTAPAYIRAKQTLADNSVSYSRVYHVGFESKSILKTIKSSGGQGYAETDGQPAGGIHIREDRGPDGKLKLEAYSDGWTNPDASLTWYLYHTDGEYDIDLLFNIAKNATQQFELSITDINKSGLEEVKSIISTTGRGSIDTLTVLNVDIPKTGFYKYELKPLSPPNNNVTISGLLFNSLSSATADVHATAYLSSPSVHLGGWRSTDPTATSGKKYDWCYQEILVPTGGDALSTYYMSLGVLDGYMGIQTNSDTQRGVIFSMWDDGDTDADPTLDQQKRAGAVDADPRTTVSRFGNEGTGTKSFVHGWNWDTNEPVKFLTNARLEAYHDTLKNVLGQDSVVFRENTLISAWFNSSTSDGWQYISTLRLPNKISYFTSWYSFLENFGFHNGQLKRFAYYYNAYAHEQSSDPENPGRWINMNQVNFSNTDGKPGQRRDFEQGQLPENPNYFYMSSGGYGNDPVKTSATTTLQTDKSVVESLDLDKFLERVDEAVAKEKIKNDIFTKDLADKTNWQVESFSSEETSGEGPINGRAATTIDGDLSTFWHSRWQGGVAGLPHHIAIDMQKTESVIGFIFKLSGGTTRHMKSIELWGSTDGDTYTLMQETNLEDKDLLYVPLSKAWNISKFKLVINDTQTGEVFCRINEIDAKLGN